MTKDLQPACHQTGPTEGKLPKARNDGRTLLNVDRICSLLVIQLAQLKENFQRQEMMEEHYQDVLNLCKEIIGTNGGQEAQKAILPPKIYNCNICEYTTPQESILHGHLIVHAAKAPCKCPYCEYATSDQIGCSQKMQDTLALVDKTGIALYCTNDNLILPDPSKQLTVNSNDNNIKTILSDSLTSPPSGIQLSLLNQKGGNTLNCTSCSFTTLCASDLDRKVCICKALEPPFKCLKCEYRAFDKAELDVHMLFHGSDKPHKCPLCDFATSRKASLDEHLNNHIGSKSHQCPLCNYKASHRSTLCEHLRAHAGVEPHACYFCDYKSFHKSNLSKHMHLHTGDKPFKCALCDYRTSLKSNLGRHMHIHTSNKIYDCPFCEYKTSNSSHLNRHMPIHTGDRPHKCSLCEYSAPNSSRLNRHMDIHSGHKPHKCPICVYRTYRKSDLERHMHIHTGERPHKCSLCDYKTYRKSDLDRHMHIHTGDKPHACALCDYRTYRKSDLKKHMHNHTR